MTRLLATTVIRHSKVGENATGHILEVDWEGGRVLHSLPTPDPKWPSSNDNPRGGLRGGRGVEVYDGRYFVANYDTVYVYDDRWRPEGEISHPLSTDIHEIDVGPSGIWLSCSRYDLALKLGFDGRRLAHWHVSDSPRLVRRLGLPGTPLDLDHDYRQHLPEGLDGTHLNSVRRNGDGGLVVSLGRVISERPHARALRRVLARPEPHGLSPWKRRLWSRLHGVRALVLRVDPRHPDEVRVLASHETLRPSHNGRLLDEERSVMILESGELVVTEVSRRRVLSRVPLPGTWFRGLVELPGDRLLVGTAPCGLVEVDLAHGRVTRQVRLSDDPNESIHGLARIP